MIISDAIETPIHETTQGGINDLLDSLHEVDYDIFPDPENKQIPTGDTYQSVYKEVWKLSGIYHRRAAGC